MNKEEQFDFYWKNIFDGLTWAPIEFSVYRFDQSLSLPDKFNKLYKMFKQLAINNQQVMDYLKEFVETFDKDLYDTVEKVLEKWLDDGVLATIANQLIGYIGTMDDFRPWDNTVIEKTSNEFKERFFNAKWGGVPFDKTTDGSIKLQEYINSVVAETNPINECVVGIETKYQKTINILIPDDIVLYQPITIPNNVHLYFKGGVLIPNCKWNVLFEYMFYIDENSYNVGIHGLEIDGLQFGVKATSIPSIIKVDANSSIHFSNLKFTNFDLSIVDRQYNFIKTLDGLRGKIHDITIKNIKALGNKTITDTEGSIRLLTIGYKDNNLKPCNVDIYNIYAENMYNVDADGNPFEEDCDLFHIYPNAIGNNISITNVKAINVGKRVIKVQLTNGVRIKDVYIRNNLATLIVSYAISILSSDNVTMENIYGYGKIDRLIETNAVNNFTIINVDTLIDDITTTTGVYFATLWINDCKNGLVSNITGKHQGFLRIYGKCSNIRFSDITATCLAYGVNMFTNANDVLDNLIFENMVLLRETGKYTLTNNSPFRFTNTNASGKISKLQLIDCVFLASSEYIYGGVLITNVTDLYMNNVNIIPLDDKFSRTFAIWNSKGKVENLKVDDTYNATILSQISQGSSIEFISSKTGVLNVDGASTQLTITRCDIDVWFSGGAWAGNETETGNITPYISKWRDVSQTS